MGFAKKIEPLPPSCWYLDIFEDPTLEFQTIFTVTPLEFPEIFHFFFCIDAPESSGFFYKNFYVFQKHADLTSLLLSKTHYLFTFENFWDFWKQKKTFV